MVCFLIRWPGASLILIRGHRHLHECAYIGDDSSEELDELMEILAEGGTIDNNVGDGIILDGRSERKELCYTFLQPVSVEDGPSNRVDLLTKHRPEVSFHDPKFDPKLRQNAHDYVFKKKESETEEEINTKVYIIVCNK